MEMAVEGRREKAATKKVSRQVYVAGQGRPKSSYPVKASTKAAQTPSRALKARAPRPH